MIRLLLLAVAALSGGPSAGQTGQTTSVQPGQRPAIQIDDTVITEEEFIKRVQSVTATELSPAMSGKGLGRAGDFAIQSIIATHVILKLAREHNVLPTDSEVESYETLARRYLGSPAGQFIFIPIDPFRDADSWTREARAALSYIKLMGWLVPVSKSDLDAAFTQLKPALRTPAEYRLRIIEKRSAEGAKKVTEALKTQSFESAAQALSDDRATAEKSGDIGTVRSDLIPKSAADAVATLKPGEFTREPVKVIEGPGKPVKYLFVQLVDKKAAVVPDRADVGPILSVAAILKKDPQVNAKLQKELRDLQLRTKLTVFLKGYDELVAVMTKGR